MSEISVLFPRAVEEFGRRVDMVKQDQWHDGTPNPGWDVRALVNHLVNEDLWVPPLLEGKTIEEVGDAFDGDLLGQDPVSAWQDAADKAVKAVGREGVEGRTVHVSFGDIPGRDYLAQVLTDHVIHSWDLARAIGAEERLDPELIEWVHSFIAPQAEAWRTAGAFGSKVEVPEDADAQTKLLGLTGRKA